MANPIKVQAKVSAIIDHGDGIFTITFLPLKRVPRFKPGQFLHLTLNDYDIHGGFWPESRVFSIASRYNKEKITIVYSVKGKYTTRMAHELAVGKKIWLKFPYGNFVINASTTEYQDVILVAGGTGISPFVSYLETELQNESKRNIHLIYGVRKKSHIVFKELLHDCLKKLSQFSLDLFLEKNQNMNGELESPNLSTFLGKISSERIFWQSNKCQNPIIFLSGPPLMISTLKHKLLEYGINVNNIKIDEWE